MSGDHFGLATLLVLFGVVAFGAIVPVLPTGAAVSSAAVLAQSEHAWEVLLVIAVGGVGAYVGDLVTYGALRAAGEPLARRVGWLADGDEHSRPARLRERSQRVGVRTAAPLGLCFLPAFFLIGIVPTIVATFSSFSW